MFTYQTNCAICGWRRSQDGGILCYECARHESKTVKQCSNCRMRSANSDGVLCDLCYYKGLREENIPKLVFGTPVIHVQPIKISQKICCNGRCTNIASSSSHRGYCNTCDLAYQQGQQRRRICSNGVCTNEASSSNDKGYCRTCYSAYQQGSGRKTTCLAPYCNNRATHGEYCSSHPQRVNISVVQPVQAHYVPPFVPAVVQPRKLKPCGNHCGQTVNESEHLCGSCSRLAKEKGLHKCNVTGCSNMVKLRGGRCNNCAYQSSFAGKLGLQQRVEPQRRVNHW